MLVLEINCNFRMPVSTEDSSLKIETEIEDDLADKISRYKSRK